MCAQCTSTTRWVFDWLVFGSLLLGIRDRKKESTRLLNMISFLLPTDLLSCDGGISRGLAYLICDYSFLLQCANVCIASLKSTFLGFCIILLHLRVASVVVVWISTLAKPSTLDEKYAMQVWLVISLCCACARTSSEKMGTHTRQPSLVHLYARRSTK